MNSTEKRVRFKPDTEYKSPSSKWSFLKYLLTLKEDLNYKIITNRLVEKFVITPDDRSEVMKQTTDRERTEKCVEKVMEVGSEGYELFCEALRDSGYNHVVEALNTESEQDTTLIDLETFPPKTIKNETYPVGGNGSPPISDNLAVVGVKMSISALSKDAKANQDKFATILQRQTELEQQLVQVMNSLDTARYALDRERQEKIQLYEQMKIKDTDLYEMQRKYRDLQRAMVKLKETNNKYHEKVTKLQIENEEMRKAHKDKYNYQTELEQKNKELEQLKRQILMQERQISEQEVMINQKLSMIDQLVVDHHKLADSQEVMQEHIEKQTENIGRLLSEKEGNTQKIETQQKQLNDQSNQLNMLHENMQKLALQVQQQTEQSAPSFTADIKGKRLKPGKPLFGNARPFNATGKAENSKSTYWKDMNESEKTRHK